MQASDFDHRCTEPTCCVYGQPTSTSCLCHKTREDMMLAALSAERHAKEEAGRERDAWKTACQKAGVCMSCAIAMPDPHGCYDCLNTGWEGGAPIGFIPETVAPTLHLDDEPRDLLETTPMTDIEEMRKALKAAETRSAELARALDREIAHADELRQSAMSATMREAWDVAYTSLRRARALVEGGGNE